MLGLQVEIFALPTNVTLAIGPRYAQHIVMLRMHPGRVNLRRLALLNDVFDSLQRGGIDLQAAIAQLRDLDSGSPQQSPLMSVLALASVAVGVAVLLGGGIHELIVAALIGVSTGVLSAFTTRNAVMDRLFEVFAAFTATLIVAAYTHLVHPANLYISIVAGVVVLLPGYSLTLALHELANQDLIAGTARLGRVFAILLALGCGAFLGFAVVGGVFTYTGDVRPIPVGPAFWIAAVALLSFGLSIDLDARFRDFAWVFLASIVALGTSYLFGKVPGAHQVAPFLASLICGLVANGGAKFLRVPQPVFLVPALHVLVPGSLELPERALDRLAKQLRRRRDARSERAHRRRSHRRGLAALAADRPRLTAQAQGTGLSAPMFASSAASWTRRKNPLTARIRFEIWPIGNKPVICTFVSFSAVRKTWQFSASTLPATSVTASHAALSAIERSSAIGPFHATVAVTGIISADTHIE